MKRYFWNTHLFKNENKTHICFQKPWRYFYLDELVIHQYYRYNSLTSVIVKLCGFCAVMRRLSRGMKAEVKNRSKLHRLQHRSKLRIRGVTTTGSAKIWPFVRGGTTASDRGDSNVPAPCCSRTTTTTPTHQKSELHHRRPLSNVRTYINI